MKIGIVCYPTFGGSGVVATELGLEMAELGHEVHFITYSRPVRLGDNVPRIHYHEVEVRDYPLFDYSPYELVLTSKLVSVVKKEQLNILHVHYAIPHASAAYMAKKILKEEGIELPIVCTLHGTDITLLGKDASFEPVITFAINKSDGVTAVSDSLRLDTLQFFNVRREIDVIPNFINLKRYQGQYSDELRKRYSPDDRPIIVHTSNFRRVKRVPDVVKIFAGIRKEMPASLLLIGDGPERYHVEQMCRYLKICKDIHFIGKSAKVEGLLAIGDLFLLPSETESFGLAALEAMASGMPVVSSNSGGLPEVNTQGESGYLYEVGDIDGMTQGALSIIKEKVTHQQFKEKALAQANKFSLEAILPQYLELYLKLT